jgi:hypothetical protein
MLLTVLRVVDEGKTYIGDFDMSLDCDNVDLGSFSCIAIDHVSVHACSLCPMLALFFYRMLSCLCIMFSIMYLRTHNSKAINTQYVFRGQNVVEHH